jgi:hypothetical protein
MIQVLFPAGTGCGAFASSIGISESEKNRLTEAGVPLEWR